VTYNRHVLGWLLIVWRFVTVYAWLGGPLYVFDLIKNGDDDLKSIVIASVPIALMLVGSFGFSGARLLVRIGLFGSVAMFLLCGFATISHLFYWPGQRDELLVLTGLAAGFLATISYGIFARTYLARPR
jgi:hypothetical protein